MRLVIQRVKKASVSIDDKLYSKIDSGLLLLVAFNDDDTKNDLEYAVRKVTSLRIFEDEDQKMNFNIKDIEGSILSVSQFTLFASTKKGARPSFTKSGNPDFAKKMYDEFNTLLSDTGISVKTGEFGADMQVELLNDGPVTICIDTQNRE